MQVKSVNTQGVPVALDDITVTVSRSTWESYKRREVDGGARLALGRSPHSGHD